MKMKKKVAHISFTILCMLKKKFGLFKTKRETRTHIRDRLVPFQEDLSLEPSD